MVNVPETGDPETRSICARRKTLTHEAARSGGPTVDADHYSIKTCLACLRPSPFADPIRRDPHQPDIGFLVITLRPPADNRSAPRAPEAPVRDRYHPRRNPLVRAADLPYFDSAGR